MVLTAGRPIAQAGATVAPLILPKHGPSTRNSPISRAPAIEDCGGIRITASSRSSATSPSMTVRSQASMCSASSRRCEGVAAVRDEAGSSRSIAARAPLQAAVDRGDGRLEQVRDLAGLPAEHVAQDQDRALAPGHSLDRGEAGRGRPTLRGCTRSGIRFLTRSGIPVPM